MTYWQNVRLAVGEVREALRSVRFALVAVVAALAGR